MENKKIEEAVASPQPAAEPQAQPTPADVQSDIKNEAKSDMRKKILILVLLLLCVGGLVALIVFRSGIPLVDFWTVVGSYETVETEMKKIEKIENVSGVRVDGKGVLALYSKSDANGKRTQSVVHLARGAVLATYQDTETVRYELSIYEASGAAWYSVASVTEEDGDARYSLALCDIGGKEFAKQSDMTLVAYEKLAFARVLDLVRLGREVYRIEKNGTVRQAFTMGDFATLPALQRKVGDYYFILNGTEAYIYNDKAVLTATYHVPASTMDAQIFILADGTLLAQYITFEGEGANDYTYSQGKERYKLHQILVSARNGAQTSLNDPEFFITSVLSDEDAIRKQGLNAGIANLVSGYYVKNALLDMSEHSLSTVLMSNRGRISSEVRDIIPAMYGGKIYGVAKNRWVAENLAGEYFLLNEWGSVIGNFPSDVASLTTASSIFVYDEKIYDWDLTLLYDMKDNGILSFALVGSSVLMYKDNGETLVFDPEKETAIMLLSSDSDKHACVLGSALISVERTVEGKKQFAIYNERLELLQTIEADSITAIHQDVNGKRMVEIIATTASGTELYLATVKD